jgi:hypothetical protein
VLLRLRNIKLAVGSEEPAANRLVEGKAVEWCRRRESNPRPRDYETLALPLSYAGTRQLVMLRSPLGDCQALGRSERNRNDPSDHQWNSVHQENLRLTSKNHVDLVPKYR